jgi:membrane associated rhomboid family serine protease
LKQRNRFAHLIKEVAPMTVTETQPRRITRPVLGFAYLMTGIAVGCIVISGVLGSIFSPDLVSTGGSADNGYTHQHVPLAAYSGWIWAVIALAIVLPTAMQGIRAKVTDKAPWTILGLGAGVIWLAVMFISIFTPVMVTGTAPWITKVPLASMISVVAGVVLTYLLCRMVKTAYFQPAEPQPGPAMPTADLEPAAEDATVRLRRLAQLRDAGVITEAEFQAKKDDLLAQI